jgi:hypothetical protein
VAYLPGVVGVMLRALYRLSYECLSDSRRESNPHHPEWHALSRLSYRTEARNGFEPSTLPVPAYQHPALSSTMALAFEGGFW